MSFVLFAFDAAAAKLIIFLIIGAFYAISHLVKVLKNAQSQATRRNANVDQSEVRKKLESELEGFLKRARGEAAKPPEPPRQKEKKKKAQRKLVAENRPLSQRSEPVEAQVVEDAPRRLAPRLEQQHLDTSQFDQRAKNMTHISREAEEMASHVHQTFDHQLGTLGGRASASESESGTAPQPTPEPAAPLAALLGDPHSLRNAIIMHEILARPEHRW